MTVRRTLAAVAAGLVALVLSATAALAANAYVTKSSSVYKLPNSNSLVVGGVSKGDFVNVTNCKSNYCFLDFPGKSHDGWVSQSRLASLDKKGKPVNGFSFSFTAPNGGPSISIGAGPGGPSLSIGVGPQPKPVNDEVCFYRSSGFKGGSMCAEPGDSEDFIGGSFKNNIGSISVEGDAEVTICTKPGINGICKTYDASRSNLGPFEDNIASYEVD